MIIDLILDRQSGDEYNAQQAHEYIREEETIFDEQKPITTAIKSGKESEVKKALKTYIIGNGYPAALTKYIDSVNWL